MKANGTQKLHRLTYSFTCHYYSQVIGGALYLLTPQHMFSMKQFVLQYIHVPVDQCTVICTT